MTDRADPKVSVIVANYNGEKYLEAALQSALDQSLTSIEVIFVDDCSTDASAQRAIRLAERDSRLKVVALEHNGGPSRARNEALRHARGEWIAVLDSDDLMHPQRLQHLVEHADSTGSDIVADDLLVFYSDGAQPHAFLGAKKPFEVSVVDYIDSNHVSGSHRNSLGFLKPLFRRCMLERWAVRYDETLVNSEDYELVLSLLLKGVKYSVSPTLGYFYRKHEQSISHRLGKPALEALLLSDDAIRGKNGDLGSQIEAALDARRRSIIDAIELLNVVDALKSRSPVLVLKQLFRAPASFFLLRSVVADKWRRRFPARNNVSQGEESSVEEACKVLYTLQGS